MGLFSGIKSIFRIPGRPLSEIGDRATELKDEVSSGVNLITRTLRSLKSLSRNRAEPSNLSFNELLFLWGIAPNEIDGVIKGMGRERLSLIIILLLAFYALITVSSLLAMLSSLIVIIVCAVSCTITTWRISCLKSHQFTPFKQWLAS